MTTLIKTEKHPVSELCQAQIKLEFPKPAIELYLVSLHTENQLISIKITTCLGWLVGWLGVEFKNKANLP